MADSMRIYEDLKDFTEEEIEKILKKDDITKEHLECLDKLVDIAKDAETIMAMKSEYGSDMQNGYSNRMYPHYMMDGNGMMNGNSYRSNNGRYSNNQGNSYGYNSMRGYSRTDGNIASRLESMMAEAPTEREREAIRRALEQM